MPIKVTCPKCQGVLHAPDDAGGKRGKCPTCGTVLAIPAESPRVASGGYDAPAGPADQPRPAGFGPSRQPDADDLPPARNAAFGSASTSPPAVPQRPLPPTKPLPSTPTPSGQGGPFAKSGRVPAGVDPEAAAKLARAWRRARGGLFWIQAASLFFMLAWVGSYAVLLAETLGTKFLPDKTPGYLGVEGLGSAMEVKYALAFIPATLGLVLLALGRFGFSNVPKSSMARGTATLASLSTFVALCGAVAFLAMTVGAILNGVTFTKVVPTLAETLALEKFDKITLHFMHGSELSATVQRAGFVTLGLFIILADLYFLSALGRVAAHLGDERLSRRVVRRSFYYGILATLIGVFGLLSTCYQSEYLSVMNNTVWPQLNGLGNALPLVHIAVLIAFGVVVWFFSLRLVGAGRAAIAGWLEQNDPTA